MAAVAVVLCDDVRGRFAKCLSSIVAARAQAENFVVVDPVDRSPAEPVVACAAVVGGRNVVGAFTDRQRGKPPADLVALIAAPLNLIVVH